MYPRTCEQDKDAIEHIGLSFYGALAGALFVAATAFSFVAIPLIGVSLAQGIWGGCAILVSCFWGVVVFGNKIEKPALMPVALLLLVVGKQQEEEEEGNGRLHQARCVDWDSDWAIMFQLEPWPPPPPPS